MFPSDLDSLLVAAAGEPAGDPSAPPFDLAPPPLLLQPVPHDLAAAEAVGVRLVHLLMSAAAAVSRGDSATAISSLTDITALTANTAPIAIVKVSTIFADALLRRLCRTPSSPPPPDESAVCYHHYYESCPFVKFAHFTANQAILESFAGFDSVHVVDFGLMHGLQWPALIQALALRPGGPPMLRVTGIGPPSPAGRDDLRDVGLRLAGIAQSARVKFAFRGIAATRLEEVQPWMLQISPGEAVVVNSIFQLHRLLAGGESDSAAAFDGVVSWIAKLKPRVLTVVEQEADNNRPAFLERFTDALFYYSTVFDALDVVSPAASPAAEAFLQQEICNVLCCDGADRVERHEPLARWRARLTAGGLSPVTLGPNALRQARMLLTLFSGGGFAVAEDGESLQLAWNGRPLVTASAWRAAAGADSPPDGNGDGGGGSGGAANLGENSSPWGENNSGVNNKNTSLITDNNNKNNNLEFVSGGSSNSDISSYNNNNNISNCNFVPSLCM